MAAAFAQSAARPDLALWTHPTSSSSSKENMVTMTCHAESRPRLMKGLAGLRGSNSLDFLSRPVRDFNSMVKDYISARRGRASRVSPKAMFGHFTEKAIKAIMISQEEARRLGHNFVGTEQILLGLIAEGTGIAAKILKSMGVNLKDARVEVEKIIGRGSGFVAPDIPYTPRAKHSLELSLEEGRHVGHDYLCTEHLLLGLLREGEGTAAKVLESMRADPSNIRLQGSFILLGKARKLLVLYLEELGTS